MKATIGQKIAAAVLSEQLGISSERAMKLYIHKQEIHPSWEAVGEQLLTNSLSSARGFESRRVVRRSRRFRSRVDCA